MSLLITTLLIGASTGSVVDGKTEESVVGAKPGAVSRAPPQLPTHLPPSSWQTWSLARSTITMQCNGSGWSSPERGAEFGIVSYGSFISFGCHLRLYASTMRLPLWVATQCSTTFAMLFLPIMHCTSLWVATQCSTTFAMLFLPIMHCMHMMVRLGCMWACRRGSTC
jgi:hypothetical protein